MVLVHFGGVLAHLKFPCSCISLLLIGMNLPIWSILVIVLCACNKMFVSNACVSQYYFVVHVILVLFFNALVACNQMLHDFSYYPKF